MKSLRLRSVVFALVVVPLLGFGFGRTPKLSPNPTHVAPQSTVDAILQVVVPPGGQGSGTAPWSGAWQCGDQRNRARNAGLSGCVCKLGNQTRPWFRDVVGKPQHGSESYRVRPIDPRRIC